MITACRSPRPGSVLAALLALPAAALAQAPQPPTPAPPIPVAADVPYPGALKLFVDATDTERRIFRVKQTVPVARAGPMTLLFPMWLPGNHAPRGQIEKLAGLTVFADGRRLEWTRDPVEVAAFHVQVPAGAAALELEFQYVSPTDEDQGRIVVTNEMMNVQWNAMALYPAGFYARQIPIEASIRLPAGWDYGVALETAAVADGVVTFKPVSFEVLVDSPMFAGRWFKKLDLDPGGRSRVTLNVMADSPDLLEVKPEQLKAHRDLVVQADRLFGARHFDHYDLLLALTDRMGRIGLEHHRSSENGTAAKYFTDWDKLAGTRDLLPHEYAHSWNGKFRRPADLWTPTFNTPMRDSLLWVYEGQTQYWGFVLAARSGLLSRQEALDAIGGIAAMLQNRVARAWRPLADTTNDPIINARRPLPWTSWQRSEDYYSEGQLVWLDVDTLIRERSGGAKSLDDFAKAFFGVRDGDWNPLTYDFGDMTRALDTVQPNDWPAFFKARLDGVGGAAPLDGLARGGYRLVYTETPTDYFKDNEGRRKVVDLTYSLGLVADSGGKLTAVQWEGPAFKAGLSDGVQIVAVDGLAFDADRLKAAVKGRRPVELIVKSGERFRTVRIDYVGGPRYPRLERVKGTPDRLGDILAPRGK